MRELFKRYSQLSDEILWVSHDFWPYMEYYGVTLTSAASTNVDAGLTIQTEGVATDTTDYPATSNNVWSAQVTATVPGVYTFRLRGTFSDGTRQVFEFEITILDG